MFVGLIIMVVGVLSLLNVLIPGLNISFNILWPCFLILCAFYNLVYKRKYDTGSAIILFIGIWFLLVNIDVITGSLLEMFWPLVLILTGVLIMINTSVWLNKIKSTKIFVTDKEGFLNFNSIFGGTDEIVKEKAFVGANVHSIFGGSELDFSEIELKEDNAIINVYSVFGGSELRLPKNVNLKFNFINILGGSDNKTRNEEKKEQKTISINSISIFGGNEFKN